MRSLDGLGLTAKDDDGFRLRSDGSGEPLSLASVSHIGAAGDIMELEQDYLHLIGIELKNKPLNGPHTLGYPGKEYMLFMEGNFGLYTSNPWLASWTHAAPVGGGPPWAPDIGALDRSMKVGPAGATITEGGYTPRCDCPISDVWLPTAPANTYPADPSGTILRLIELHTMGKLVTQFSPERIAFGKEINQIHGDQKFFLAVAGHTGSFRGIVFNRTNFLNAPDTNVPSIVGFYSELNYFVDGKDNLSD